MELADIKENSIKKIDSELLNILLKDRTTDKNIIWATDNYSEKGEGYLFNNYISWQNITGYNGNVIRPRVAKSQKEQEKRIKEKAEVFTPSWICNAQNNLIDNSWAGEDDFFNIETEKGWKSKKNKIVFPTKSGKNWEDYIKDTRLEVSCGEAPYLVSRYDNVTGNVIDIQERIGLLDRKLRIINENVDDKEEWNHWAETAYKNIYGFEYQGDNLLIARENLLFDYIDNYIYKFNEEPTKTELKKIATIISWNIWQMDGIKYVIPNSCKNEDIVNYTFFGEEVIKLKCEGCTNNKYDKHNGIYCKIMNWETNRKIKYTSLLVKGKKNGK